MLEILIPIRNPTDVFERTIDSLLSQTHREFSVLLSDNFSTDGKGRVTAAAERLRAGGIPARVVHPPHSLGRVEHWNWLHHQSTAEWLKPLFVGDWLEPDCLAACHEAMTAEPELAFIFFYFKYHGDAGLENFTAHGLSGRVKPSTAAELAIFAGNFVGGPINVLYRRAAFESAGGHSTSLTLLADFDLYVRLTMAVPTHIIPRSLGNFLLHNARFAKKGSGTRRESMNAELLLLTPSFRYAAGLAALPVSDLRFSLRLVQLAWHFAREIVGRAGGRWRRALLGSASP